MSKTVGAIPSTELLLDSPAAVGADVRSELLWLGTLAGAGALALYGLRRGGWLGLGAVAAGSALFAQRSRAARHPYEGRYHHARGAVTVLATPEALLPRLAPARWPQIFTFAQSVEAREDHLRITLNTGGAPLVWDCAITHEDDRRIHWRARDGAAVPGEGEIRLVDAPGGRGTEVHARILLGPPAAWVGAIAAGRVGHSGEPGIALIDDLRRLKQLVETGEIATTLGQPRGAGQNSLAERTRRVLPTMTPLEAR